MEHSEVSEVAGGHLKEVLAKFSGPTQAIPCFEHLSAATGTV